MGSSPRVRGKPRVRRVVASRCRLIPACAGKTASKNRLYAATGAHPRVCGENLGRAALTKGLTGSSPRVRGKLPQRRETFSPARLIPACAGKTFLVVVI